MGIFDRNLLIWTAGIGSNGYGKFKMWSKSFMSHRASWVLHKGEIPEGLLVLHKCDTPVCVNPDHLFLGTHQENMDDKARKGRAGRPGCLQSHCNRGHEFTDDNYYISPKNGKRYCRTV